MGLSESNFQIFVKLAPPTQLDLILSSLSSLSSLSPKTQAIERNPEIRSTQGIERNPEIRSTQAIERDRIFFH